MKMPLSAGALMSATLAALALQPAAPAPIEHIGMCDASAAVAVGPSLFITASDEENVLRLYHRDRPGKWVESYDLTGFLKPEGDHIECDIEGAAWLGDRVYWVGSHGNNKDGEHRSNRHRLFATEIRLVAGQVTVKPVGDVYRNLLDDLLDDADWNGSAEGKLLRAGRKLAPEKPGGLNIEGLAASPGGDLLIGFRNPLIEGKAIVARLKNPKQVLDGNAPRFGKPIRLALEKRGIRSIDYWKERGYYVIVAGPTGDDGDFALYRWSGNELDAPVRFDGVDLRGLHPEAVVTYPGDRTGLQLISDDGQHLVGSMECKQPPIPQRRFRSLWVTTP